MRRIASAGCVAALLLLLSGCAEPDTDAELDFDGEGNDTHSDTAECDTQALLTGTGQVHNGLVRISVADGAGEIQYDETFNQTILLETEGLSGASGTWTLQVERRGADPIGDTFRGSYDLHLSC